MGGGCCGTLIMMSKTMRRSVLKTILQKVILRAHAEANMAHPLLELAQKRTVVFDGAMGTEIQRRSPPLEAFQGHANLNEILVLSKPDLILDIHRSYLEVGADVIETNTFGANRVVLQEFGCQDMVTDINFEAARLARKVADEYSTPTIKRFVSGSIGPGTKLPSLGQIAFQELYDAYFEQATALIRGGVDAIQVETCQDPLQAKIAVIACLDAMKELGKKVFLFCQVTFDTNQKMLLGTEPLAALVTLANIPGLDAFGLNCSTGPEAMYGILEELASASPLPLSVLPNAGLPENKEGRLVYPLDPATFSEHMVTFVRRYKVEFVGGCCGTTPAHISALVSELSTIQKETRTFYFPPCASSLFIAVAFSQDPRPLIIGERTNATGSKKFSSCIQQNDIAGMLEVARSQQEEGAHMLDVSLALPGRDESQDAKTFVSELRGVIELPLFYDSTEPSAIEEVLKTYPGRLVINSVNMEDGGKRLRQVASLARKFGAGLVVTCIDENGMCMTAQRKVECAKRIVEILQKDFGFKARDIFVDPLTFTLASGDPSLRTSAIETFEAIRKVKQDLPEAFTILGVSNCSYGLEPRLRRYLNSVFLHHALEAGLDAAILNAGKIVPLSDIPEKIKNLCEDLVFNRGEDPLRALLEEWERSAVASREKEEKPYVEGFVRIEDELKRHILQGDKKDLEAHLKLALKERDALSLVHEVLLEAMKEVGERFARGEMQLPFVLRSAEVMKACVSFLEPYMERKSDKVRGTIVLATVRGDVHDIGKNLVDILLSNNGFRVINLGTKCPINKVIEALEREKANAIGLSGLLVKSVMVMREDVEELERQGIRVPVLLGGAALNRAFVVQEIAPRYSGKVFYCKDAFDGLKIMEELCEGGESLQSQYENKATFKVMQAAHESLPVQIEAVQPPVPLFVGTQLIESPPIEEVAKFVNRTSLFRGQWQFRKGKMGDDEWNRLVAEKLEPMFQEYLAKYYERGVLKPRAIIALFFANSNGDKVTLYDKNGTALASFSFPKMKGGLCLADFVLPQESGQKDVIGAFVVTLGHRVSAEEQKLFEASKYAEYLFLHGLGVELTEALAEWAHRKVREVLLISQDDDQDVSGILKGRYRGGRFSFGYPACPNLEDNKTLLTLLDARRIGVYLTESLQMVPRQTVSSLVFHHPQVKMVY